MGSEEEEEVVTTRIFVGGLGESVSEVDLEKTFSSLGIVRNTQIIRTNGRSFAYMDFQPSSPKSLSKLFSTYNGCIWKGGRLRLEKAKDHYLVRLKREWAGDANLAVEAKYDLLVDKNTDTLTPSKLSIPEKMQLHIFFPRLRKLKSLPYTGTGKHKYSFQRILVPSLPVNFCDCEEHSGPCKSTEEKQVAALVDQSGSVNEEEVNLMKSVMNNIFEKGLNLRNPHVRVGIDDAKREMSNQSIDDSPLDESESDEDADVDNLVTNMVRSGSSKLGLSKNQDQDMISKDQEMISRKRQLSRDGPAQTKLKAQKGNSPISRKQLPSDRTNREEIVSSGPKRKGDLKILTKESNGLQKAQTSEQKASINQSGDLSWKQKSSWRKLVGEKDSFNLSNILQGTPVKDLPKSNDLDAARSIDGTNQNLVKQLANEPIGECPEPFRIGKNEILHSKVTGGSILAPSETPCKDSAGPKDANPSEQKTVNHKKTGGHSWIQKSSWRELVDGMDNGSFSIANVVQCAQNLPKSNNRSDNANSTESKELEHMKSELTGDSSKDDSGVGKDGNLADKSTAPSVPNMEPFAAEWQISTGMGGLHDKLERNLLNEKDDNCSCGKPSENKNHKSSDKKLQVEPGIGEFCTFMRSAASEREWMKTRAALSGALKKKSNEK